jgi:hypothetical protein
MPPSLNEPTLERRSRSAFVSAPAPSTDIEVARAGMRMYRALSTVERLLRDGAITPPSARWDRCGAMSCRSWSVCRVPATSR